MTDEPSVAGLREFLLIRDGTDYAASDEQLAEYLTRARAYSGSTPGQYTAARNFARRDHSPRDDSQRS